MKLLLASSSARRCGPRISRSSLYYMVVALLSSLVFLQPTKRTTIKAFRHHSLFAVTTTTNTAKRISRTGNSVETNINFATTSTSATRRNNINFFQVRRKCSFTTTINNMAKHEGAATTTKTSPPPEPSTNANSNTDANNNNNNKNKNLVVVLAGPTAVGKSDVAAQLCQRLGGGGGSDNKNKLGGLIVSADSVQAYRGVQIGANKPTIEERNKTPHLLVDIVDCEASTSTSTTADTNEAKEEIKQYNAAEWQRDALYVISSLLGRQQQQQQQQTKASATNNEEQDPFSIFSTTNNNNNIADQERRKVIDQTIADAKKQINNNDNDNNDIKDEEPIIVPVVVGGTMMYLQWLVHGRPDAAKPSIHVVEAAQKEIQKFQNTNDWEGAVEYVASKGLIFAQRITKLCGKDWYRLRRTLEIAMTTTTSTTTTSNVTDTTASNNNNNASSNNGMTIDNDESSPLFTGEREGSLESFGYDVRCFFLCPDVRMAHTKLVDERCEMMITKGLLKETTNLKLAGQLPDMAAR